MTPLPAQTSIDQAIQELRRFPRAQWLDLARSDQSLRWRRGIGVRAEDYFDRMPEVHGDTEEALVLINGEIKLREELGEAPTMDEYQKRFPGLADDIAMQFSVNRILSSPAATDAAAMDDAVAFPELPGYVFVEEIARGASGVVFKARQESLGRFVAVKVIPLPGADATQLARHRQEAEILAQLNHPNIVHIHEVREHRGALHLVMEYVCGTTLADHNGGRPLSDADAARLTLTLAETVQVVHKAGVLHRDLKPSNVLVTESGALKISDFGLAKLQARSSLLTAEPSVLGTPSYMAPEQADSEAQAIGPEADVYSLGAILYELLTGRPPFLGVTALDTLSQIRTREPVAPRQLQPKTPRDLETICLKCLSKTPRQRYGSAAALAEDLRRFGAGLPILARPPGAVERFTRLVKRRPAASALVGSAVLLAGLAAFAISNSVHQRRELLTASLVDSISTADASALPQLLGRISSQESRALPLIRAALSRSTAGEPKWVNLSAAELSADANASVQPLLDYLPGARVVEIPVIVESLAPRADKITQPVWQSLLDENAGDEARLCLACLAARIAPDDSRWNDLAPTVVRALVQQQPLDMGILNHALQPARAALVPPLVLLTRDSKLDPLAKSAAVNMLARYAADQPRILVDLILGADVQEFRILFPSLRPHGPAALEQLRSSIGRVPGIESIWQSNRLPTNFELESTFDAAQRRQANALAAMWRLSEPGPALKALERGGDASLRAWLIELLSPLGVSIDELRAQLAATTDSGVRQALILALGQATWQKPQADLLAPKVAEMHRFDPDAGVHAACEWLLRRRLNNPAIDSEPAPISPARQWYIGPNGHSFTVLRGPLAFTIGSPSAELLREPDEEQRTERIDRSFAIGCDEVTVAQFRRFRETQYVHRRFSPTDDCPMNNVSWFDAVSYCRWLSEKAGISEEQMCYPSTYEIKPGMVLPADFLQRTGYRLPTEAEWEYACRGGVTTSRPCGDGGQLLARYAWYLNNSDDHAWPVGMLKPNDLGLFDMLGNVAERCHDPFGSEAVIGDSSPRILRGADFGAAPHNLRSARRSSNLSGDRWASVGFRVARTIQP